jgi:LPXTG-motif cell wall-anchored protein
VYQVQAEYRYQGTLGSMTVNYASDGTSAWVSMPPQTLWPGVVVTQQRWILAPDRTVAGFEGRLTPQPIPTGSSTPTAAPATDSSLSTTQLLIIVGLVVVIAGIGLVVLRRRRAHPTNS